MYSTPVHFLYILGQTFLKFSNIFFQSWNVFPFFSQSWSELTDIRLNKVRVNEVKLYRVSRHVLNSLDGLSIRKKYS